jgi:hypothetical protein
MAKQSHNSGKVYKLPAVPEIPLPHERTADIEEGYTLEDILELKEAAKTLQAHFRHLADARARTVAFAGGDPEADAATQRLYAAVEHQYQAQREFRRLYTVWPDLDRWVNFIEGDPSA